MQRAITLFTILFLSFSTLLLAGEPQQRQGSKSLHFTFTSLADMTFDGAEIGGRYFFMNSWAIDLDLGFTSKTTERPDPAGTGTVEDKESSFMVTAGVLNYPFAKGPVAMFWGPFVGIGSGSDEPAGATKRSISMLQVGLTVGAEWWAWDNVSLAAGANIGYSSTTTEDTPPAPGTVTEEKVSRIGFISGGAAHFTLSFYF